MPLLSLNNITKLFGANFVLEGVTMQLEPGDKGGLIGPNGSGKSTLLKIITGELEYDEGSIHKTRGTTIGYLPQEPNLVKGGTLRFHLEEPLRGLLEMMKEIKSLEKKIAATSKGEEGHLKQHLENYGEMMELFEEGGGYQAEKRIETVALGLGFEKADLERELATFSGGEKTRARLAALLLQEPDLLLLDEPTNYLDLTALEWLEKYLRDWKQALLVVSHDRFFLDRVTTKTFALQGRSLKCYQGSYSSYLLQRDAERFEQERSYQKQQDLLAKEERLVREAKADERSKRQARSRQKRLDKLDLVERPTEVDRFHLNLGYTGRSGKMVVSFEEASMAYGEKPVFENLNFEIQWGDRVALVGPNGAGKSTLLKLIAAEVVPVKGQIRLGPSVKVVYFAQEQEQLNPSHNLLEEIAAVSNLNLKEARSHLGHYLFRGDDVFKKVGNLSGGEKSRLALARLALNEGNCLLMDEPTSHLDLPAVEELEKTLSSYQGTIIVVSHDRYFLQNLANRVLELKEGRLNIYNEDFQAYLRSREAAEVAVKVKPKQAEEQKKQRLEQHRRRQEQQRQQKRLKEEQSSLEEEIAAVEEKIISLEEALSDPDSYGDFNRLQELGEELDAAKSSLTLLFSRWEEVSHQLE